MSLVDLRNAATKLYTAIIWLHVPAVVIVALNARNAWLGPVLALLTVAILATVAARVLPNRFPLRAIIAAALTAGPILFVYAARGATSGLTGSETWQIDYHMYFFAVFAMLVGYVDWRAIAVAAALTAVHHLALDLIAPAGVFPEEGLDRVALHAITVVAECSVLIWITRTIASLYARIDTLVNVTAAETAAAIASEQAENDRLRRELAAVTA